MQIFALVLFIVDVLGILVAFATYRGDSINYTIYGENARYKVLFLTTILTLLNTVLLGIFLLGMMFYK